MPNSLLTGVSGLLAHQRLLEVVGNNIANVNTVGYKSQRAVFGDLLYETLKPSSAGQGEAIGGINPIEVGGGVTLLHTDRKFSQGSLENTGEQFDMAITGNGFFVVSDGNKNVYTRSGSFSVDEAGTLVAPGGLKVVRFPGIGEPDGINPGFQIPGDNTINIPFGATIAGTPTTSVSLLGNLSSSGDFDQNEVITSATSYLTGGVNATGATTLNSLESNITPYQAGDEVVVSGFDLDGSTVNTSIAVDATSTLQDVVDAINGAYTGLTATIDGGNIVVTANSPGETGLEVRIRDQLGNVGGTSYATHDPVVTTDGTSVDRFPVTIEVYDTRGGAHDINFVFEKLADDVWELNASIDADDGTILKSKVENIVFDDSGRLVSTGDPTLSFEWEGILAPQTINISLTDGKSFELSHFETKSSVNASQDGVPPGTLVSANVESGGEVSGVASNGKTITLAQMSIASFANTKGLRALGQSTFEATLNSGEPDLGTAGSGDRGLIKGGSLEQSNVDIAFEFTRLIVAQRGFSANARTITISDEILEELANIIR